MVLYFIQASASAAAQSYSPSSEFPGVTSVAMQEELFEKPENVGAVFDDSYEKLISLYVQDQSQLDVQCTLAFMKLYIEAGDRYELDALVAEWEKFKKLSEIHKPFFRFLRMYCDGSRGQQNLPMLKKLHELISSSFSDDPIQKDLSRYLEVSRLQLTHVDLIEKINTARASGNSASSLEAEAEKIERQLQSSALKKDDLSHVMRLLKEGVSVSATAASAASAASLPSDSAWEREDLEHLLRTLIAVIDGFLGSIQTFKNSWDSTGADWAIYLGMSGSLKPTIKSRIETIFGKDYSWLEHQLRLQGKTVDDITNIAAQLLTKENVEAFESVLHVIQKTFQRIDFDKLSETVNSMSFQPGDHEAWVAPERFKAMLPWFKNVSYPQIASIFHTLAPLCINFKTMEWGIPHRNSEKLVEFALNPDASLEIFGAFQKFSSIVLTMLFNVPSLPEESRKSLEELIQSVLLDLDKPVQVWWKKSAQAVQVASASATAAAASSSSQEAGSSQSWSEYLVKGANALASPVTQTASTMSFLKAMQILANPKNKELLMQLHDILIPAYVRYIFPDCSWCVINDVVQKDTLTPEEFYQKMNLSIVSEKSLMALAKAHRSLEKDYKISELLGRLLLKSSEAIENAKEGDLKAQLQRFHDAVKRALDAR